MRKSTTGIQLDLFAEHDFGTATTNNIVVPFVESSSAEPVYSAAIPQVAMDTSANYDLFAGLHKEERRAEDALLALDAAGLHSLHKQVIERYPRWEPASRWPVWAKSIELITGTGGDLGSPRHPYPLVDYLLELSEEPDRANGLFSGMGRELRHTIITNALHKVVTQLAQEDTECAPGCSRRAGYYLLRVGRLDEAIDQLKGELDTHPGDSRTMGYLGEALWRAGRQTEALTCFRDAYLQSPAAVDEQEITCDTLWELVDQAEELDLQGELCEWVPVLMDLMAGIWMPPPDEWDKGGSNAARQEAKFGEEAHNDRRTSVLGGETCIGCPAREFAKQLGMYRGKQTQGAYRGSPELITLKRAMLKIAPSLVEYVRTL